MSDLLFNLATQSIGTAEGVRPLIAPRFAPAPLPATGTLAPDHPAALFQEHAQALELALLEIDSSLVTPPAPYDPVSPAALLRGVDHSPLIGRLMQAPEPSLAAEPAFSDLSSLMNFTALAGMSSAGPEGPARSAAVQRMPLLEPRLEAGRGETAIGADAPAPIASANAAGIAPQAALWHEADLSAQPPPSGTLQEGHDLLPHSAPSPDSHSAGRSLAGRSPLLQESGGLGRGGAGGHPRPAQGMAGGELPQPAPHVGMGKTVVSGAAAEQTPRPRGQDARAPGEVAPPDHGGPGGAGVLALQGTAAGRSPLLQRWPAHSSEKRRGTSPPDPLPASGKGGRWQAPVSSPLADGPVSSSSLEDNSLRWDAEHKKEQPLRPATSSAVKPISASPPTPRAKPDVVGPSSPERTSGPDAVLAHSQNLRPASVSPSPLRGGGRGERSARGEGPPTSVSASNSQTASGPRAEGEEAPIIRVTIGRVEVRAALPAAPPSPRRALAPHPTMTLSEYLQRRKGEKA